jgi:hypothetical protein
MAATVKINLHRPYHSLPFPTLPYLTLPYPTLPYLTRPCPTLPPPPPPHLSTHADTQNSVSHRHLRCCALCGLRTLRLSVRRAI